MLERRALRFVKYPQNFERPKDISFWDTVKLGDKELFGHPKIVP